MWDGVVVTGLSALISAPGNIFSVHTLHAIGTFIYPVADISQQVFWRILLTYPICPGAVPSLENFRLNFSCSRCAIAHVQVGSGFDLSPEPSFDLCWYGCTFHLHVSHIAYLTAPPCAQPHLRPTKGKCEVNIFYRLLQVGNNVSCTDFNYYFSLFSVFY